MGETYSDVDALGELSKLKELCSMISENEFVLNRNKVFEKSRYVIIARLEKATTEEEEVGVHLKEHFKKMMQYSKNERKLHNDMMKSELQAGLRESTCKCYSILYNLFRLVKIESALKEFKKKLDALKKKY